MDNFQTLQSSLKKTQNSKWLFQQKCKYGVITITSEYND